MGEELKFRGMDLNHCEYEHRATIDNYFFNTSFELIGLMCTIILGQTFVIIFFYKLYLMVSLINKTSCNETVIYNGTYYNWYIKYIKFISLTTRSFCISHNRAFLMR